MKRADKNMTKQQEKACHAIIHSASTAAAGIGGGMAQIPGSDTVPITALQVGMVFSLGLVFRKDFTKVCAKELLTTVMSQVGPIVARVARGVSMAIFGWIPALGNVLNATTAAGITEWLGWTIANTLAAESEVCESYC